MYWQKIAGLLISLMLAASAGAEQPSITPELVIWHSYPNETKQVLEQVIEQYNQQQSVVSIRALKIPFDAFEDKLNTLSRVGQGPDMIIYLHDKAWPFLMKRPVLENLQFFVEDTDAGLDRFIPATLNGLYFHQQLMGLPLSYYTLAVVYNPALMPQLPDTMPQVMQFARTLKQQHPELGMEGFAYEYSNYYFHAALLHAFGGQALNQQHLPELDSDASLQALTTLKHWVEQRDMAYTWSSPEYQNARFKDGRLAMYWTGPWVIDELSESLPFAVAPMPYIDAEKRYRLQPYMNIEAIFMTRFSKQKYQSYLFMQYLSSDAVAQQFNQLTERLVANQSIYQSDEMQKNIRYGFYQQALLSQPIPFVPEMHPVWESMQDVLFQVVSANAAPKTVLQQAQQTLFDTISRYQKGRY